MSDEGPLMAYCYRLLFLDADGATVEEFGPWIEAPLYTYNLDGLKELVAAQTEMVDKGGMMVTQAVEFSWQELPARSGT